MKIIETIDNIGIHERERDIERGNDLHDRTFRLLEAWEINPTRENQKKYENALRQFQSYCMTIAKKYNIKEVP